MEAEPPKSDPPKRKRRWFQFSLRSLMIVVTLLAVVCGYVGWQANIVSERRETLRKIGATGGRFAVPEVIPSPLGREPPSVPFIRRWLGDHAVSTIFLKGEISDEERNHLKDVFPEAVIFELPEPD